MTYEINEVILSDSFTEVKKRERKGENVLFLVYSYVSLFESFGLAK